MTQLGRFDRAADAAPAVASRHRPDADTERLLATFRAARAAEGAHPRSVAREVSQLRALVREAGTVDPAITLRALLADIGLIARSLREPTAAISRSTGRARLLAVQRCIRIVGPSLGREPGVDLAALDTRLPARRSSGWHTIGTLVAGRAGRRRRWGPTLDAVDLRRLIDAAGAIGEPCALRNRALVALHCFSGLRPEEIVRLRWEDLATELTRDGRYGLTATVARGDRRVRLLLPEPAPATVDALAAFCGAAIEVMSGPVISARGASGRQLSYRAARDVLHDACRQAGLPIMDAVSLRAACAHWLRAQGLSDQEVAAVLGLARVRSVDRLLRHHAALDAQRSVREVIAR